MAKDGEQSAIQHTTHKNAKNLIHGLRKAITVISLSPQDNRIISHRQSKKKGAEVPPATGGPQALCFLCESSCGGHLAFSIKVATQVRGDESKSYFASSPAEQKRESVHPHPPALRLKEHVNPITSELVRKVGGNRKIFKAKSLSSAHGT